MSQAGRIAFGNMEAVTFGRPAAEAVAEEVRRCGAERVFLMVSGTLNRATDEIAKVCRALGNRCAGLFDHMPPHTPRRMPLLGQFTGENSPECFAQSEKRPADRSGSSRRSGTGRSSPSDWSRRP